MKKFLFRLDRVLEFRRLNADLEKTRLGVLERQLEAIEAQRARLEADYLRQQAAVAMDPQERIALSEYAQYLGVEMARLNSQRAQKQQDVLDQRARYTAANQKLEVLSRLKEKQFADWGVAADKETDALAMDSFLSRWRSQSG